MKSITRSMKSAACLTIKRPGDMTKQGRADIAKWLRSQATRLVRDGTKYNATGSFTARYMYGDSK